MSTDQKQPDRGEQADQLSDLIMASLTQTRTAERAWEEAREGRLTIAERDAIQQERDETTGAMWKLFYALHGDEIAAYESRQAEGSPSLRFAPSRVTP